MHTTTEITKRQRELSDELKNIIQQNNKLNSYENLKITDDFILRKVSELQILIEKIIETISIGD